MPSRIYDAGVIYIIELATLVKRAVHLSTSLPPPPSLLGKSWSPSGRKWYLLDLETGQFLNWFSSPGSGKLIMSHKCPPGSGIQGRKTALNRKN